MQIKVQIDSEIPEHIVNRVSANACKLEEKLAIKHKLRFKKGSSKAKLNAGLTVQDSQENPSDFVTHDISEGLAHFRTTVAKSDSEEDVDVKGKSIFGFQSSHKRTIHVKRPKDPVQERSRKIRPSAKRKQLESETKKTDFESKRRVKRKLEALKDDRQSSEEDSSEEDEDEEDEKEKRIEEETTEGYERYFQDLHGSSKTSNNTLSKLQVLEPQEFHNILEKAPKKHVQEIETLKGMQRQYFPQWFFELQSGFNLVFYGYGSKRNLLNEFAQSALKDGPLIVINGFFPAISIKDILAKIIIGALGAHSSTGSIDEQVSFICDYFAREDREYEKLYIMVHNLDGANLRNERTQMALSTLASGENIHLVASVDHINAGLLWDNIK
ncbi:origin recognition complex subunit 2-domain-containing protein, partial [Sporodiniella umbellata]